MKIQHHIRIFLIATVVWAGFWVAGLPDYYQQYSLCFTAIFLILVLVPIWAVIYYVLKRVKPRRRLALALWLSFYFTVPLAVYDFLYCGLYLGEGMKFLVTYWYLTIYYIIPWVLLPLVAMRLNRGEN
ncbi:MAG: hypothetical protein JRJ47_00095 [Deltaproteobacteria bacterium]|nr:hypothetical protein [Deltaproteobacteria bacterium]